MRRGGVFKNNDEALASFGSDAYRAIPKSVFALVAFHFAQRVADEFSHEGALRAISEEVRILADNGLITKAQMLAATRELGLAIGRLSGSEAA